MSADRLQLHARIAALIDRLADGSRDDGARDALLCEALGYQAQRVEPYGRLLRSRGVDPEQTGSRTGCSPDLFPALPTDVFRHARVASHPPQDDLAVFRTSGTTGGKRGEHHLSDLSLYQQAARAAARHALFPDLDSMLLLILAPPSALAPDSSLSYMLSRFIDWFAAPGSAHLWRDDRLDLLALERSLGRAARAGQPVALLGTSFAFVYAEEALGANCWSLAKGSRLMLTGGFKGRTREVPGPALLQALGRRYAIEPDWIIQEYGMTELCSQMYETSLRDAVQGRPGATRRLWAPGWVRCSLVQPESLQPLSGDGEGLLRIDDLANLDSVCAVQTSDLAKRSGDAIRLIGRAPGSVPRGCSIAVDEALNARPSPPEKR